MCVWESDSDHLNIANHFCVWSVVCVSNQLIEKYAVPVSFGDGLVISFIHSWETNFIGWNCTLAVNNLGYRFMGWHNTFQSVFLKCPHHSQSSLSVCSLGINRIKCCLGFFLTSCVIGSVVHLFESKHTHPITFTKYSSYQQHWLQRCGLTKDLLDFGM